MRIPTIGRAVKARATCLLVALVGLTAQLRAFTHPCIPTSLLELDTIKGNLDKQPWKSAYAGLAGASTSQLSWPQEGPWETVSRTPDVNLTYWKDDMNAVYNLARMWYFTGNEAYAQKAHDIILSWANTQTSFGGHETALSLGDFAVAYAGGADILRGTWPGWTEADTIAVKNYFENVTWPATIAGFNTTGPANKGMLSLEAGIAIAAFCDDTEKFNHCIDVYRSSAASGLFNTLPTGEMGETGRDEGHSYGTLLGMAVISEIAWKQGVDLYSELDNRLLACGEYYARNSFALNNPFVPFGTIDYTYYANNSYYFTPDSSAFLIIRNAYKNRLGIPTPWIDRRLESLGGGANLMYGQTADFSSATPLPAVVRPPVSLASSGLTLTTLGSQTAGRSVSYSNGEWTMTGLGGGTWIGTGGADDCQFAYQAMTGDCAMVVRVTSATASGSNNGKVGLMIRDNLSATVSRRAWIGIVPNASPMLMECRQDGWTDNWGGSNWARRSQGLPLPLPYWLKIERRGDMITTYTSQDGTSWAGNINSYYANLPATVYIGMFLSSGTATANTATFDHVAFTGGSGGLVTTPAAPATLFASGSGKAITVRWLPSFGATAYDLLRSTTSGSGYTVIASDLPVDKTSYVDTSAAAGTTYYYVARAKNSAGTSGNSPEFDAALLPAPMVNLATTGTANDDQNNPANAGNAFDQDPGSLWFHGGGTTGWLQYDFGAGNAQVVRRYTINSASLIPERDPKDWQFQASNDGTTWVTLDTQTGQAFTYRMQRNVYDLSNTTAYRYYRLNITANNGDASILHIGDLGLWNDSGRTIPDGRYVLVSRNSNKVMKVTGTANGTPVVQQTFVGDDTQQWNLAWQGNGVYQATQVASAKALDNGGTSTAGANLVIQPSNGGTSQLWKLAPDSDGFYRIESANSGLVADVSGGSTADGANIVQSTYTGSSSQQWMPTGAVQPQPTPPAPTGLTGSAASIYQINLSWTASPGAVSYLVKRSTVSGGPYTTIATGVNVTDYTDSTLSSNTTYYYVVSALNGSGEGSDSAQIAITTPTAPPGAPTGVTTIVGTGQVSLAWAATGGATSYTVKRATTSGGPYTTLATGLTGTSFTDTSVTQGSSYYYVIVANNADGSGPGSAEVAFNPGGMVVQLGFDETGGTTAADSGGGHHDATLLKGASFSPGLFGNALDLPATSSQYASLPEGIVSGLTDFTIAAWVKVNAFTTWSRIFDFGTGTDNYMFLVAQGPAGAGLPRFSIRTSSVAEQTIDSSVALTAGTWAHVAVTRSGNTVSLYINGTLAGSATITISPADLGFTTLNYLGKSQFSDPSLNAAIDDFRIYSQALSSTEISALANPSAGVPSHFIAAPGDTQATLTWLPNATTSYTVKRSTTSGGPYTTIATSLTDLTYLDTGLTNDTTYYYVIDGTNAQGTSADSAEVSVTPTPLRLQLKFDESSGAVAVDSSSRANNATLVNGPAFSAGKISNALTFNAASFQYATLPGGIVSGLTDFTIATWIKVNTFTTWQRIFDFGTGTNNYMFLTTQYTGTAPNNAKLRFGIRSTSAAEQNVSATVALSAGVWTHVAVTRSGNTVSIYINGSVAGSGTITTSPADLGTTTLNYLGKSQFNDPYLNASLDDFRIYSRAMSASELTGLVAVPPTPTGLAATPGTGQVALSWNSVSGASSYNVKRATTSGGTYTTIQTNIASTSFTDTGLTNGATYYYVVSANNAATEGSNSAEASATLIPDAPTGLTTTPANGQVTLSWDASTGTSGYTILRATSPSGPYTTLATGVTGTSYADTTAESGWTYYYAVTAGNSAGQSQASASATTTAATVTLSWLKLDETTGTTAADAAGNTNAGTLVNSPAWIGGKIGNALSLNGTNQYVTLPNSITSNLHDFTVSIWVYWNGGGNWQRIFDFGTGTTANMFLTPTYSATGKIRFAITTAGGGGEQRIDGTAPLPTGGWHHVAVTLSGTTGTLYVDGVQVGQNTAMTLRPSDLGATTQNRIGRSQYNDPYLNGRVDDFRLYAGALTATRIAELATPIQTTGLAATGGSGQIALAWNATTGATSYTVGRATTSGDAYTVIASGITGTSHTDTGLANGTTYYYVVTPANASGDGANAAEVAVATVPAAPGNVTATAGNGQATLNWSASTGATGYSVLRATSPNGSYTTVASDLTGTSYTDTGLASGTTYYYAVAATNGSGSSANSTQVNALTAPAAPTGLAATADNAQVSLQWNASTGAPSYSVLRSTTSGSGYTSVASNVTGTTYTDTGLTNGTAYYYVVTATNTTGTSANSGEASATPVALPSPWATSDVGSTGAVGSASRSPSGVFTINGAGADIWGSSDAFRYVYQAATGDCDITARVVTLQNTHNAAKAGVMIRESLNTNSRHAMTNLTAVNGLEFLRRTSTGGSTGGVAVSGVSAPGWVRLVRSGDTFTSYRSSDGVSWTTVGSVTIPMSSTVYIGLLVCSHVNGTLCTATLDNVTVNP